MYHKLTRALGAIFVLGAFAWTAAAPPAADALSNCSVNDASVDSEEQAFLGLLNDYRAKSGAGPLFIDGALTRAATWMANDLAGRSGFGHSDSLGRSPWKRMPDCGVAVPGGENLAAGTNYSSASVALDAWVRSPSHREVMLTGDFKAIGIARVFREGSQYGWYWVTDFGYAGGDTSTVATTPPPPAPTPTVAPGLAAPPAPPPPPPPPAPPAPVKRSMALGAGISLIEWDGDYVSPESVFGATSNRVEMVYVFDLESQQWLRWGPSLETPMKTLSELRNGVQYWVVTSRAVEVTYD